MARLKAMMPDAGCRTIANTFNRMHAAYGVTVSKTWVADFLRAHRYEVEGIRRRMKRRVPGPMPRNRIWGADLTGKQDTAGIVHPILGVTDHGTRRLLVLEGLERKNAWTLLGHLFLAIGKFGKPRAVRTDNESMFRSALWRSVLRLAGIRQQLTDPGSPWMNGRIERLFGTLKAKLDWVEVASGAALQAGLGDFRDWYNHVRPHQHLAGWTPVEAWEGVDPYARPVKSVRYFSAWEGLLTGYYLRR
ncbi:MAG: transposase family protein [Betaproteobacteria bacterium]|nr:transposase family protein [Betaproteobacteria bacterium]